MYKYIYIYMISEICTRSPFLGSRFLGGWGGGGGQHARY